VCLMHESERYTTRKVQKTDAALCKLAGLSTRAFCNARKKLQERKLVMCERGQGNVYSYTICDPETGLPWPGDPKARIPYIKKEAPDTEPDAPSATLKPEPARYAAAPTVAGPEPRQIQSYGIPLSFGKTC
jgi:hypothetical protein